MNPAELKNVLDKHTKHENGEEGGELADLRWANLSGANLSGANLSEANLSGANLRWADLSGANLSRADLSRADLSRADLSRADLSEADLSGANLRGANLSEANLSGANLSGADLRWADLSRADLSEANLSGADLSEANLSGANLHGANLRGAKNIHPLFAAQLMACPEFGAFDGWKKCCRGVIVHLRIPAEARRSSATTRKCRAEFVDVLEVIGADVGESMTGFGPTTYYRAGQRVHCHEWCEDRWQECAGGIHFFITRAEAEA